MTKLVIGLGNPDEQYQDTRHNIGFMFMDHLAKKLGAYNPVRSNSPAKDRASADHAFQSDRTSNGANFDKKLNSLVAKYKLSTSTIILAKPQTYVNKSGDAVKKLIENYKLKTENLVISHDDLDIPFGNTKMSFGKNSGGHKGVESIMRALKTKKFYRLRIGLGVKALQKARRQSDKQRDEFVRDFVLSKFSKSERETLKKIFKESYNKLLLLVD